MNDMLPAISGPVTHWKSVLELGLATLPAKIVSGLYAVLLALTWGRDDLVKRSPGAAVWHVVDFLPHWSAWQWTSGALIIAVALILEGSYRRKKWAEANHEKEVEKLQGEIRRASDEIETLRRAATLTSHI